MTNALAYLDVALCVDITASMTPFIAAARAQMQRVLDELRRTPGVDLRAALVAYRDHGSLEVVEVSPFTPDPVRARKQLEALVVKSPPENTDAAEAVFTGLVACVELPWRAGAYRIVMLVGDAPPHGCGATSSPYPDRYQLDPTGRTLDDMANELETHGIFVHALAMVPSNTRNHDAVLEAAFQRIGIGTGGSFQTAASGDAAMAVVETVSRRCLAHLEFDRRLHALLGERELEPEALARELGVTVADVHAGEMRLRQRKLR